MSKLPSSGAVRVLAKPDWSLYYRSFTINVVSYMYGSPNKLFARVEYERKIMVREINRHVWYILL